MQCVFIARPQLAIYVKHLLWKNILGWPESASGFAHLLFVRLLMNQYSTLLAILYNNTKFFALSEEYFVLHVDLIITLLQRHVEVYRKSICEQRFISIANRAIPLSKRPAKSTVRIVLEKGLCSGGSRNLVLEISALKVHPEAVDLLQSRMTI